MSKYQIIQYIHRSWSRWRSKTIGIAPTKPHIPSRWPEYTTLLLRIEAATLDVQHRPQLLCEYFRPSQRPNGVFQLGYLLLIRQLFDNVALVKFWKPVLKLASKPTSRLRAEISTEIHSSLVKTATSFAIHMQQQKRCPLPWSTRQTAKSQYPSHLETIQKRKVRPWLH